jgi:hypothetical protein
VRRCCAISFAVRTLDISCLRFAEGILVLILRRNEIETLKLYQIHLESEEACWDLAAAELHNLELASCDLADGGAALVEPIREGRGPKGFHFFYSYDAVGYPHLTHPRGLPPFWMHYEEILIERLVL